MLLASMVRVQRMRMHGWPWCVITLFFMAGTTQQEVAYAATLLHDVAQEWLVGYLWRNHGKYPRDWDTLAPAMLERFSLEPLCGGGTGPIAIHHTRPLICV